MNEIRGDIIQVVRLAAAAGQKVALLHQVNCKRRAEAGLARQIAWAWPAWREAFVRTEPLLGEISVFYQTDDFAIVSLYAQSTYGPGGRDQQHRYTQYNHFENCCRQVALWRGAAGSGFEIYVPYGIGCGLGGGDWNVIYPILERHLPDATIVRFEEER